MQDSDLVSFLQTLENPLNDRITSYQVGRGISRWKYRGTESGRFTSRFSSWGYAGTPNIICDGRDGTRFEYTLGWAIFFAILRSGGKTSELPKQPYIVSESDHTGEKGRFNKKTGELEYCKKHGFPELFAVDSAEFSLDRVDATRYINGIIVFGPIRLEQMVILYDEQIDLLKNVDKIRESLLYEELVRTKEIAQREGH